MQLNTYCPEMGEEKPLCDIEARLAYYGNHYFLETSLQLKGRGIVFCKQYKSEFLTPQGQHRVGKNQYKVTKLAFEKILKTYTVSYEMLLD